MGEDKKEEEKNITNMEESEKKNVTNEEVETVAEKETTEKVEEKQEPEVSETVETQKEESEAEYVPEQLDDDDFEKEKTKAKEEKKAKKMAEKEKKEKKKIKYDENGNPIVKKKSKTKLIVIILLLVIVIVGIVAYFTISFNQPENVVRDFAIYFNNEDWENVVDSVDMQGYLAMFLIDAENYEEDDDSDETTTDETTDEEADEEIEEESTEETTTTSVSYADYDSRYVTAYDDIEGSDYEYINDIIEYGEENISDCLGNYSGYNFTIESIKSVEKIGNTDSLYKVSFLCTLEYSGDTETDTYTAYVSKANGEYKIVYGDFADAVFSAYYYEYIYSYYYGY